MYTSHGERRERRSGRPALLASGAAIRLPPAATAVALSDIGAWLGTLGVALVAMIVGLVRLAARSIAPRRTSG